MRKLREPVEEGGKLIKENKNANLLQSILHSGDVCGDLGTPLVAHPQNK